MTENISKKVERAIKLLQSIPQHDDEPIEIAYSGGKDSDVILELARMAKINFKAIYKCTTIDPPGTIRHCVENGVQIVRPQQTFFQLIEKNGMPNRFMRFCCRVLKEYPILYNSVIGVRKCESRARNARYSEPVVCRVYNKRKNIRVQQILPILDWSNIRTRQVENGKLFPDEEDNDPFAWPNITTDIPQPEDKGLVIRDVLQGNVGEKYYLKDETTAKLIDRTDKNKLKDYLLEPQVSVDEALAYMNTHSDYDDFTSKEKRDIATLGYELEKQRLLTNYYGEGVPNG